MIPELVSLQRLADTVAPVLPWDEWVQKYGLAGAEAIAVAVGFFTGKIRLEREVKREERASLEKDETIKGLRDDLRDNTVVMNRIADGIEERNKVESQLRARRT